MFNPSKQREKQPNAFHPGSGNRRLIARIRHHSIQVDPAPPPTARLPDRRDRYRLLLTVSCRSGVTGSRAGSQPQRCMTSRFRKSPQVVRGSTQRCDGLPEAAAQIGLPLFRSRPDRAAVLSFSPHPRTGHRCAMVSEDAAAGKMGTTTKAHLSRDHIKANTRRLDRVSSCQLHDRIGLITQPRS